MQTAKGEINQSNDHHSQHSSLLYGAVVPLSSGGGVINRYLIDLKPSHPQRTHRLSQIHGVGRGIDPSENPISVMSLEK